MKHLIINLGQKMNNKDCDVIVDRNIIISGQTGAGKSCYAQRLLKQDDRIELISGYYDVSSIKEDTKLVIIDDVYKIEEQDKLKNVINELNKKDIYVALVVISSKHINKISIRDSYIVRIQKGFEDSRTIIFEDNNNSTQLTYEN